MEICCDLCGREFSVADYCYDLLDIPGAAKGATPKGLGSVGGTVEDSVSAFESEALASVREPQTSSELRRALIRPFGLRGAAADLAEALAGYSKYLCSQCYHTICGGVLDDLQRQTAHRDALEAQTAAQERRAARLSRLLAVSERPGPGQPQLEAELPQGSEEADELILRLLEEEAKIAELEASIASQALETASGAVPGAVPGAAEAPVEASSNCCSSHAPGPRAPVAFAPDPFPRRRLPFIPVNSKLQTVSGHHLCRSSGADVSYDEINAALCDLSLLVYLLSTHARLTKGEGIQLLERVRLLPVLPSPIALVAGEGRNLSPVVCELFLSKAAGLSVVGQKLSLKDQRVAAALTVLVGSLAEILLLCNAKSPVAVRVPTWALNLPVERSSFLATILGSAGGEPGSDAEKGGEGDSGDSEPDEAGDAARSRPPKGRIAATGKAERGRSIRFSHLNIEVRKVKALDLHGRDMFAELSGQSVFVTDKDEAGWQRVAQRLLRLVEGAREALGV